MRSVDDYSAYRFVLWKVRRLMCLLVLGENNACRRFRSMTVVDRGGGVVFKGMSIGGWDMWSVLSTDATVQKPYTITEMIDAGFWRAFDIGSEYLWISVIVLCIKWIISTAFRPHCYNCGNPRNLPSLSQNSSGPADPVIIGMQLDRALRNNDVGQYCASSDGSTTARQAEIICSMWQLMS